MLEQINNALPCVAVFTASGVAATGLTVTVDVFRWNGSAWSTLVTGGSATEVGDGAYSYQLAVGSNTVEGLYFFAFKTSGTADIKVQGVGWAVQKAGIEDLDALISSRAPAGVTVTTSSPVASTGVLTIVPGDDYFAVDSRSMDFTFAGAPSLTSATAVTLAIRLQGASTNAVAVTGSVLSSTQLRFEPTSAQTLLLAPDSTYNYQVQVLLSGTSHVTTLEEGTVTTLLNLATP